MRLESDIVGMKLMTGHAGEPHITSADDGAVNTGLYSAAKYVLNFGQKFSYEIISNNLIRIKEGYALNQGRKMGIPVKDYEECTIDNGLQGVKRTDLIVIRYEKNMDTGIETSSIIVLKGTSGDSYKDPAYITGNILEGAAIDDMPLYRVSLNGLSIEKVEPLFEIQDNLLDRIKRLEDIIQNAIVIA